ncbi:MAG: Rne/Rng family ribonuclease [Streptosporangiales bacterium]|nr:Rne/Rng family ribonuclease [Streptosporangiales bacterium]
MQENDSTGGENGETTSTVTTGDDAGQAGTTAESPAKKTARTAKKSATKKVASKRTAAKKTTRKSATKLAAPPGAEPAAETPAGDPMPQLAAEPAPRTAEPADAVPEPARPASRRSASRPPGPPDPVFLPPRPVPGAAVVDDDTEDDDEAPAERPARKATARKAGKKAAAKKSGRQADRADDESEKSEKSETSASPAAEDARDADTTADTTADTGDRDDAAADADDDDDRPRRRRRRGGRGRRRRTEQDDAESDADDTEAEALGDDGDAAKAASDDGSDETEEQRTSRRRRRRRRRGGGGGGDDDSSPDDPPNTVVRVRKPRESDPGDEVTALKGSTRLEAKRQRRREGRDPGRRRAPVLSESEFLARREAVERTMVIRQVDDRTQIAVLEDGVLVEHYVERGTGQSYVGNVYLGRVQNVLPSMEAAFIDIGRGRNAVLYAGEVNFAAGDLGNQPKRIESVLKSGQSVLVQVTKGPIGQKGARLTSQVGLPGRYLVYSPEGGSAGISRKLPDKERERLKQVLKQTLPENGGVIVRTAAEGASEEELSRDVSRLAAQWEAIQAKAKGASAPALLHEEPDLTVRVIRDAFNEDVAKLVVAGDDSWAMIEPYVEHVAPHLAERVERWTDSDDVFRAYRIDEQLAKALDRKVFLPSGGSLVIDRTEAMTVVDVNTGKFTGQGGNLEETVTRNNLEAAEEIVRQLRLRDIGGIVVVDFIDMVLESNRDLVLRRLVECLARDRTRHQVAEVTSLGLVQMTRKRIGQGLLEAFSTTCDCCDGRGLHISLEPVEHERTNGSGRKGQGKQGGGKGKKKQQQQQQQPPEQAKQSAEAIAAIAASLG